jgi:mono/diheme cytochrome c family protein
MVRVYTAGLVLVVFVVALVMLSSRRGEGAGEGFARTEINRGFTVAPVRLNLKGKDRDLVGLGSYIVNAQGDCSGCHTSPTYESGFNPFQGQPEKVNATNYLAGGQSFGPFVSRNLTPDANGRPAGRTFAEFRLIMRTGRDLSQVHPQISPYLQVMPWPAYSKMTDTDIRAIYEYLRAIPPAQPAPPAQAVQQTPASRG